MIILDQLQKLSSSRIVCLWVISLKTKIKVLGTKKCLNLKYKAAINVLLNVSMSCKPKSKEAKLIMHAYCLGKKRELLLV